MPASMLVPIPLNVPESPRIPSYQETFGFSLGGPLVIPKIYNGGNKTSWFASYNLQRGRTGLDSFSTVPTLAERGGDFSDAIIASGPIRGNGSTIYDPLTSATGARTAFRRKRHSSPSDSIPPRWACCNTFPSPTFPGRCRTFICRMPLPTSNDRVMGRIGQQINSKNSLNVMYYFNRSCSQRVNSLSWHNLAHFEPRPEPERQRIPYLQSPPGQYRCR